MKREISGQERKNGNFLICRNCFFGGGRGPVDEGPVGDDPGTSRDL